MWLLFVFFKQKTAYEMRISDWSSDVCSSDLRVAIVNAEIFPSTGFGADDCFMSQHRSSLSVIAMPSPASAAPGSPLNIVDRQFAVMSRSYCRPRQSTDAPPAMKDTASDLGTYRSMASCASWRLNAAIRHRLRAAAPERKQIGNTAARERVGQER